MATTDDVGVSNTSEPCYEGEETVRDGTPADVDSSSVRGASAGVAAAVMDTVVSGEQDSGDQTDCTALELMWQRLSGRGQSVAERMNINVHKGATAVECENRDEALIQAFRALDVHKEDILGPNSMKALVTLDNPSSNAIEAEVLMKEMDQDQDGKVSLMDWEKSWEPFKQNGPDGKFYHAMCAIVHGLRMPVDYDPRHPLPRHPDNNEEYLRTNISKVLSEGLEQTLKFMKEAHIKVASGDLWDSDGFLPKNYIPACPVRFLGEWLRSQINTAPADEQDPLTCDWRSEVPKEALTTTMKLKVAFLHLDPQNTGFVAIDDVRALLESFTSVVTPSDAAVMIEDMDLFDLHDMNLEEFMELMGTAFKGRSIEEIDSCLSLTLLAYFLSKRNRALQIRYLFDYMSKLSLSEPFDPPKTAEASAPEHVSFPPGELPEDLTPPASREKEHNSTHLGSGNPEDSHQPLEVHAAEYDRPSTAAPSEGVGVNGADVQEQDQQAADWQDVDNTQDAPESLLCMAAPTVCTPPQVLEWAIVQAILRRRLQTYNPADIDTAVGDILVDYSKIGSGTISQHVFSDVIAAVYKGMSDLEMANEFALLMNGNVELDPAKDLIHDLKIHVKSHPLYGRIAGASVSWVLRQIDSDDVSEVIGVDCRSIEEFEVSTILQAIPCEAFPNPSAQYSYDADPEGLEEVQDAVKISLDTPTEARPVVVAFCLDGSRSLVVAAQLIDQFPSAQVVVLTGGLIAWYNAGAPMEDADGNSATDLHPGFNEELQDYIQYPEEEGGEQETDMGGVEA